MRRLVMCCDGTWNQPDELKDGIPVPTNVTKVALGLARVDGQGNPQLLYYHPGVGTSRTERFLGGAFGYGLSRNVRDCYRFVVETYEEGDELYFFGFSRGAYTARSAVGLIRNSGILHRSNIDRIPEAYALYRSRTATPRGTEAQLFRRMYSYDEVRIHFVGVWDTVGALGIPIDGIRLPFAGRLWGFHDTALSSYVGNAFHALSIDEQRGPFRPTLWQRQAHSTDQRLEQVWFSGVHCDVGGGYTDPSLSEIALLWMVQRATECELAFQPGWFRLAGGPLDVHDEQRHFGAVIAPEALGLIHQSRKGFYKLLPRHVRPLEDPAGSSLSLSSSARRRREQLTAYDAAEIDRFLGGGGAVSEVIDHP
jgi:uncharacterized protein (DUF2235 family)